MKPSLRYLILFWSLVLSTLAGCRITETELLNHELDSISKIWVPDRREGICEARLIYSGPELILKGETNIAAAKDAIAGFLSSENISYTDSLLTLPDTSIIKKTWALVGVSVCNIRSGPSHADEMISQAVMGTPVKILKKKGGWYYIQTPDLYLGWVDSDGIIQNTQDEYHRWKSEQRVICLLKTGDIMAGPGSEMIISDIVAGAILVRTGEKGNYTGVKLPDGREGFIESRYCRDFPEWASSSHPEAGSVVKTAASFMGTPYLWGGTSPKGMDCSGFDKTVFFLNGLILARDVSLQFRYGREIDITRNTDSLEPGDLLFFGSVKQGKPAPTHVAIYIGDTEFIHSSGMVRINSLDPDRDNYSAFRRNSLLGARRIIGEEKSEGIQPVSENSWYN